MGLHEVRGIKVARGSRRQADEAPFDQPLEAGVLAYRHETGDGHAPVRDHDVVVLGGLDPPADVGTELLDAHLDR
jgi:hypothetical protein